MTDVLEILKIIEQGFNTNAPAETVVNVIKQYCESVKMTFEQSNQQQTEGGNND